MAEVSKSTLRSRKWRARQRELLGEENFKKQHALEARQYRKRRRVALWSEPSMVEKAVEEVPVCLLFKHPFTCLIAGPTGCGKTTWVKRFLKERSITPQPERVVWVYGAWQPEYATMNDMVDKWIDSDLPKMEDFDPKLNNLLIIDDLMSELSSSSQLVRLFTKGSHHRNISILYLIQNLFHKGKEHRTISLNAHYLVLFKNPRDATQIIHLAKQMYPLHSKFLQESYKDATTEPYGYLLIDLKQTTPDNLRVRTNIFSSTPYVYLPRIIKG